MHPAYFETRFHAPDAGEDWPQEFVIISAYATTGHHWSRERNASADRELADALRERTTWLRRVTGYSPETGHAEPSWAAMLPFEAACDLGVKFEQDAIYSVAGDELSVSYCDARRQLVPVGSFRERLHDIEMNAVDHAH